MPNDFKVTQRGVLREPAKVGAEPKVEELKRDSDTGSLAPAAAKAGWQPKPGRRTAPSGGAGNLARAEKRGQLKNTTPLMDREAIRAAMGLSPEDLKPSIHKPSAVLSVLGADRFATVTAVRIPNARVAWVNFDLARELGFNVPANNRMTPEFEKELLDALAYSVLKPGEEVGDRQTIQMFADRYGGSGLGWNGTTGSTRAGFFRNGNLLSKGFGVVSELQSDPETMDFHHGHGHSSHLQNLAEAGVGELGTNLLTKGSRRGLAILDSGEKIVYPDDKAEEAAGQVILAGPHLRPGHLIEGWYDGGAFSMPMFVRSTAATGDLQVRQDPETGETVPDVQRTILKLIDNAALTAAELYRWRAVHGAISTSNMGLEGRLTDAGTFTTQERTARIKVSESNPVYGREQEGMATELGHVYRAIVDALAPADRQRYNAERIDASKEMRDRYAAHLEQQLLQATGFKPALAQALHAQAPLLTKAYVKTLNALTAMSNRTGINVDKKTAQGASVVDVFGMLQKFPKAYFEGPPDDRLAEVKRLLAPEVTVVGEAADRMRQRIDQLAQQLVQQYDEVMVQAEASSKDSYDSSGDFRRAVETRAGFENEPITAFVRTKYREQYIDAIDRYAITGDRDIFRDAVDKTVAQSVRSVEGLLAHGSRRKLPDGGFELERRTIDGIDYSVRGWDQPGQPRRLHVSLPAQAQGDRLLLATKGSPSFTRGQLEGLRYRVTTDGWKTSQDIGAILNTDEHGQVHVDFDLPALGSTTGRLEGAFFGEGLGEYWLKDGNSNFHGYTYAVPDGVDLRRMETEHGR